MKKFFQAIGRFFANIFSSAKKFNKFLLDHVDDAIAIAGNVRDLVNNPALNSIIDILPEKFKTATKDVQEKILSTLEKALADINISAGCLAKETIQEKIACFVAAIKGLSPMVQNGAIQKLATAMVMNTEQGKEMNLSEHLADTIVLSRLTDQKNSAAIVETSDRGDLDDDGDGILNKDDEDYSDDAQ